MSSQEATYEYSTQNFSITGGDSEARQNQYNVQDTSSEFNATIAAFENTSNSDTKYDLSVEPVQHEESKAQPEPQPDPIQKYMDLAQLEFANRSFLYPTATYYIETGESQ